MSEQPSALSVRVNEAGAVYSDPNHVTLSDISDGLGVDRYHQRIRLQPGKT